MTSKILCNPLLWEWGSPVAGSVGPLAHPGQGKLQRLQDLALLWQGPQFGSGDLDALIDQVIGRAGPPAR